MDVNKGRAGESEGAAEEEPLDAGGDGEKGRGPGGAEEGGGAADEEASCS